MRKRDGRAAHVILLPPLPVLRERGPEAPSFYFPDAELFLAPEVWYNTHR
jgi:hypothetical protein